MVNQWKEQFSSEWRKEKPDSETVDKSKKFGEYLAQPKNELSTSQLRKFFGEVKRLQLKGYENAKSDIIMLKPKLAYAVGRAKKGKKYHFKIEDFYEVIADGIDNVNSKERFKNFTKIFESIVAFHKANEISKN